MSLSSNKAIPATEKLEDSSTIAQSFPFFLKIASGTNGGRGVWLIKNQEEHDAALKTRECNAAETVLLAQKATFGRVVCSQVIYDHGRPVAFFFVESNTDEDLAAVGRKYVLSSEDREVKKKAELKEHQWTTVVKVLWQVGDTTRYHGMIDIEFIVADESNPGVNAGSVWLLEFNPRFSGSVNAALSNPGFLDAYFDVVFERVDMNAPIREFSQGVQIRSSYNLYNVLPFYLKHFYEVLLVREWNIGFGVDRRQPKRPTGERKNVITHNNIDR